VIQTVDDLEIPVVEFEPTETKNENILLSVSSTDANGLSPGDEGFAGASPNGECRVYVNVTPVDNAELQELAVKRLESIIENAGGVENLKEEDLPECTSAATSMHPIVASVAQSSPCSAPVSPRWASFPRPSRWLKQVKRFGAHTGIGVA
jgi:hypothetical protein